MDDPQIKVVRGYELRESVGAGGFGAVYRAYQPAVKREVAIKIILPKYANHPDFIRRFESEAQLVARLEHIHIVPLYDYWREPDSAYLVMRWLRGGSLRGALQRGAWEIQDITRLFDQIASALTVAHRQGVIHRDIKPDNILLDQDNNAYLADFGIAKDLSEPEGASEEGMITGSPAYLSPEQILGQQLSPQCDLYSLGIVAYEMLTGEKPFSTQTTLSDLLQKHLKEPLPPLLTRRPDLPLSAEVVLQRATAKDPNQRFPNALAMAAALREALCVVNPPDLKQRTSPAPATDGELTLREATSDFTAIAGLEPPNPYKGLRAFEVADADDFFGRAALVDRLVERLQSDSPRFLAVIGPSGCGKSSLVKAGLVPALRGNALVGSSRWFYADMTPGPRPLEALADALLRVATRAPADLLAELRADTDGLSRVVDQLLPGADGEFFLVIDQFEEVFTQVEDETERAHFLDCLQAAALDRRGRLRVVITLRADFYDRPLLYPDFGDLVRKHTEVVLPLSPEELEQAIVGPANRVGLALQPGLVTAILNDVGEQPGTLPLLQYALTELFEHRDALTMTLSAYRKSGGVLGALARRADELYNTFDAPGQAVVEQLMLRLVTPGEGTEDTRRRVFTTELSSIAPDGQVLERALNTFGKYRLLTFDRDPITRSPTVEVAHEALIRTWDRLRAWLNTSRDDLLMHRRLIAATADWLEAGRDTSFLLTGSRLEQFESWSGESRLALNQEEKDYLADSVKVRAERRALDEARKAHAERLERRARRFLASLVVVLFIATLGAFGLTGVAVNQKQLAEDSAATAVAAKQIAQDNATRSESLRLAAESNNLMQTRGGNIELAALLGIRALKSVYSPQADGVVLNASTLDYARQILSGHGDYVSAAAFVPGTTQALTASWDKIVRLWDLTTGKVIRQFTGHTDGVSSIALSRNGKYLLTASWDRTARLWDLANATELRRFDTPTGGLSTATFSPDGKQILTGGEDKVIRLWDVATGAEIRQYTGFTDRIRTVVFSPDGKQILGASEDKTARLWDVATGAEVEQFVGHSDFVSSAVFSPDGQYVLTAGWDRTVRLWEVKTAQEIRQFVGHTSTVSSAVFSPDGNQVLTASYDGTARLWDTATGNELHIYSGHTHWVMGAVFSSDGKQILTGSWDRTARVWDMRPAPSPALLIGHTDAVFRAIFSPDGKQVITGSYDGTVRFWDVKTGQETNQIPVSDSRVTALAVSADGKTLLTGSEDQQARLWAVETGELIHEFAGHTDIVYGVAFSPDGKYALTGSQDTKAVLWDLQTGAAIRQFIGHHAGLYSVAFSPDGKYILTGSKDRSARLWDVQTGAEIRRFTGHPDYVYSVAFSPDGKQILTSSYDKTARLWDVETGKEIREFTGHTDAVFGATFSPDGRRILTASWDRTVRLWDAQTGIELRRFTGHQDSVYTAIFSPDGQQIVTASKDQTARLWVTDTRRLIDGVCARLLRDLTDEERQQYGIGDKTPSCIR